MIAPRLGTLDTRIAQPPAKTADPHYARPEHLVWRATVIRNAKGRCQWPGCGRAEAMMFADHIVELQDGGAPFDPANGQCLCGSHHTIKTHQARAERMKRPAL